MFYERGSFFRRPQNPPLSRTGLNILGNRKEVGRRGGSVTGFRGDSVRMDLGRLDRSPRVSVHHHPRVDALPSWRGAWGCHPPAGCLPDRVGMSRRSRDFGMGWLRGLGRLAGIGLWIVVLAPALALAPAAFLDRGPGGSARPTMFPLALVTLDPVVWDCVWNSLAVAAVVTSGSLVAGVGLCGPWCAGGSGGGCRWPRWRWRRSSSPRSSRRWACSGCSNSGAGRRCGGLGARLGMGRLGLGRAGGRGAAGGAGVGDGVGAGRAGLGRRRAAGGGEPAPDLVAVDLADRPAQCRARRGRCSR